MKIEGGPITLLLDVSCVVIVEIGLHLLRGSLDLLFDYIDNPTPTVIANSTVIENSTMIENPTVIENSTLSYFMKSPLEGLDPFSIFLVRGCSLLLAATLRHSADINMVDVLLMDVCRIIFCSSLA